jgi:hypothetical protein
MKLLCPCCHSDNIIRDAAARWNTEKDDWELSFLYDGMTCDDCNASFSVANEIELTEVAL